MKAILIILSLLTLVSFSFAQASFCLTATDSYGGGATSTGTYTVPAMTSFDYYYIFHDTDKTHKARVKMYADDYLIWTYETNCGCGTESYYYPTSQNHVLHCTVECIDCSIGSYNPTGAVSVKVYTPSNHNCASSCEEN